jgi:DNA excision repair protein ERCC-2
MFSAELDKQSLLSFRRLVKKDLPQLYQALGSINVMMVTERKRTREAGGSAVSTHCPRELVDRLQAFTRLAENWLSKNIRTDFREDLLQLYFNCTRFERVAETYDERYATIYQCRDEDLTIKLFCVDPSRQLKASWNNCKAAVLFSATLTPADYFQNLMGCRPDTARLDLISPFPADNLAVFRASRISTYYRHRSHSCAAVTRMIGAFVARQTGNYLVFFPSYEYLRMVLELFKAEFGHTEILAQTPEMVESDRIGFLDRFKAGNGRSIVGFAVMGGVFGEGIDLKGDRLTGAAIVGVGLPGICPERDQIRAYFDAQNGRGFAYAYQYPGINRVLQAAGRVIRSEYDRGAVLLIDQRYARSEYASLLPPHWRISNINAPNDIGLAGG